MTGRPPCPLFVPYEGYPATVRRPGGRRSSLLIPARWSGASAGAAPGSVRIQSGRSRSAHPPAGAATKARIVAAHRGDHAGCVQAGRIGWHVSAPRCTSAAIAPHLLLGRSPPWRQRPCEEPSSAPSRQAANHRHGRKVRCFGPWSTLRMPSAALPRVTVAHSQPEDTMSAPGERGHVLRPGRGRPRKGANPSAAIGVHHAGTPQSHLPSTGRPILPAGPCALAGSRRGLWRG